MEPVQPAPTDPARVTLRAADVDRERVAALLRQHFEDGRLTLDEFQDRVAKTYSSRTFGELDELTADLPTLARPGPKPVTRRQRATRDHVIAYVVVNLFLVVIWAVTGHGYFWPIWPILGWGLGVTLDVLGVDRSHRQRARDRRRARRFDGE